MIRCVVVLLACLAGALAIGDARAQDQAADVDARTARMTDLVIGTLQIDRMLETVAGLDPRWPFQASPDRVTDAQIACIRAGMGADRLRRQVEGRVRLYARQHGDRMDGDMQMLESDGAALFARLMIAGMASQTAAIESPSVETVIEEAPPRAFATMFKIFNDAQYAPLRELLGFQGIGLHFEDGEAAGRAMGATYLMPMLMDGLAACDVPMSVLAGAGTRTPKKPAHGH